jgi:hypothetical protein
VDGGREIRLQEIQAMAEQWGGPGLGMVMEAVNGDRGGLRMVGERDPGWWGSWWKVTSYGRVEMDPGWFEKGTTDDRSR